MSTLQSLDELVKREFVQFADQARATRLSLKVHAFVTILL